MSSSSKLGHKMTKKERLKHYLELERAGIELTEEQKDELYDTALDADDEEMEKMAATADAKMKEEAEAMVAENGAPAPRVSKKKRKQARKEKQAAEGVEEKKKEEEWVGIWKVAKEEEIGEKGGECDSDKKLQVRAPVAPLLIAPMEQPNPTLSFAEQMMQQLSSLKKKAEDQKPIIEEQVKYSASANISDCDTSAVNFATVSNAINNISYATGFACRRRRRSKSLRRKRRRRESPHSLKRRTRATK